MSTTRSKTIMGPNGPTSATRSSFGVNTQRVANTRPVRFLPSFRMTETANFLASQSYQLGRHFFGQPVSDNALSIDAFPGTPSKEANYMVTTQSANTISSQIRAKHKVSNGRTQIELDLPYYDAEALNTLKTTPALGAIAPLGSFKVKVEVLGGGVLTGTDSNAQMELDSLLSAMITDVVGNMTLMSSLPRLASASHGIMPQA
jgi:hypothetical protein